MNTRSLTAGDLVSYNDGRPGHTTAIATVLETDAKGLLVQFEDRFAPTRISHSDKAWTDYLCAC